MSILFKQAAALLLFCTAAASLSAQSQSADKQLLEQWAQRNPQVQWLSVESLAKHSAAEQAIMRASGQYLIYEGTYPTQAEIAAFESRRVQNAGNQPNADKLRWYEEKRANAAPVSKPTTPQYEVTRAELASMPEEKKAYVLAHPEIYIIKD